ncbi:hypothetical protein [Providencia rettgeri]|uniref:hypothetical protein n=1 Tax=Providencia rettgeri TaxID=587 RepID=UPI00235DDABB|nr:hypothetical protein [Providencia rettgeri]
MKTLTYAGLAILPLFCSAQAQISHTKAPIVKIASKANFNCDGGRKLCSSESVFDSFYQDLSERVSRLEEARVLLEREVDKSLTDINNVRISKDELNKLARRVSKAISGIETAKVVISESFDSIFTDPELKDLSFAADLRDRALKGMDNLMLTINKVIELRETLENRQETIVVIDIDRMNHAINSTRHSAPKGMTREERRKFILSRATA